MYVSPNFKSKAEANQAIKDGKTVIVINNGVGSGPPVNGTASVEGPHFPKPHTWYGTATIVNGVVTKIK